MILKHLSGNVRQSFQNGLILKFVIGSILENGFEITLRSCWMFWVFSTFHFFQKILSDEIETICLKMKVISSKMF